MPMVPVSLGELVDKITILLIKADKIEDPEKKSNINKELNLLLDVEESFEVPEEMLEKFEELMDSLYRTNLLLWRVEDDLRDMERDKYFGEEFVEKARSVYVLNDQRFAAKNEINRTFGSDLSEEKSYAIY